MKREALWIPLVLSACLLIVAGVSFAADESAKKADEAATTAKETAKETVQEVAETAADAVETTTETTTEAATSAVTGAADTAVSESGLSIRRMAVCEGVEERTPIGESEMFSSDVGFLYCFTEVDGAEAPTKIYHRWYVGDRMINEIPINVRASHWRCWSKKTIVSKWEGSCRVEIATEEGDVLAEREFTLN